MKKIGVLTSGGDAPGMNAAIMSIAKSAAMYGMPLVGIKHGYNGLLRKSTSIHDDLQELHLDTVLDIADRPGTYLRTARCTEFLDPKWREVAVQTLRNMEIDGLVIIGGDGSGVESVSGNVPAVMAKLFESMKETVGIDLSEIVRAGTYDAKVNRNVHITGVEENGETARALAADAALQAGDVHRE